MSVAPINEIPKHLKLPLISESLEAPNGADVHCIARSAR
jgi:hypothetical protein